MLLLKAIIVQTQVDKLEEENDLNSSRMRQCRRYGGINFTDIVKFQDIISPNAKWTTLTESDGPSVL